jgi:hypothetical protein
MWEPVGPLPAEVYLRRRWTAAATTTALVCLLGYSISAVVTTNSEPDTTSRAAGRAAVTAPQPTAPPPASPEVPTSAAPGAGEPPVGSVPEPGVTPPDPAASSAQPAGPSAAGERLAPDESPRSSLPAPPPIPVPPTGPVPCADDMISVAAEIDSAEHRVGQRPTFRLVVTNTSDQPCVRDLDSARQEIVVWSPSGDRLWSSNDCVNGSTVDLRTLVPGQPVAFAVAWAGRTSTPGCAGPRSAVPAGDYRVMSRVDGVISTATDFTRLP